MTAPSLKDALTDAPLDVERIDTAKMRALSDAATPGPWVVRQGYGPDKFEPNGYKYVQFGATEKKAAGRGTDQLAPADAEFIAAAVNLVRAALTASARRKLAPETESEKREAWGK